METSFPVFCELLLKSTAVLALAATVNILWRGASAASRHMVWTLSLATLLALPATKLAAPLWTVELAAKTARTVLPEASVEVAPVASAPTMPVSAPAQSWSLPPGRTVLAFAWLAGVVAVLGYRLVGDLRLRRLRRESEPLVDERTPSLARAVAAECGVAGGIELRRSAICRVPLAWGIWRPVVLLPDAALAWPEQRLAAALRHEFGHIRRRDCLARLVAQLACALYWMNPLVWLAARRLRVAQEQACDDLVLRSGTSASDYADLLVQTVRGLRGGGLGARHALAMAQPSTLEARVQAIVDGRRNRRPLGHGALAMGVVTALALVAASALAQVGDKPNPKGPQIEVEAKFVEMTEDAANQAGMKALPGGSVSGVLTQQQLETMFKTLGETPGVDVLSTPRVTTLPKQRATIQIIREFVYPTDWEKDKKPGTWKPKAFETRNVGVTLGVEAAITDDGTLDLDLEPEVVEHLGFVDLDAGKKELPPATAKMPAGHRTQPIFSTRKIKSRVTLWPGATVILGGMVREESVGSEKREAKKKDAATVKRHLLVFVTAKIIKPVITEKSVTLNVTSDSAAYDKSTGTLTASGNVRIETPQAVIQADKVVINPKPGAGTAAPESAAQRAAKIVIPRVEFQEATLNDALDFLRQQAVKLAAGKDGVRTVQMDANETLARTTNYLRRVREQYKEQSVNIVLLPDAKRDAKVTLNLRNVPLSEALRYVAQLTGNELAWTAEAAVIGKPGTPAAQPRHDDVPSTDTARKAAKIVIPSIEFVEAPLSSAIEFLVRKSLELDPEKKGVNIILQLSGEAKPPAITLNLRNVPLLEALKYVAQVSGLELVTDKHALRLQPSTGNKQP